MNIYPTSAAASVVSRPESAYILRKEREEQENNHDQVELDDLDAGVGRSSGYVNRVEEDGQNLSEKSIQRSVLVAEQSASSSDIMDGLDDHSKFPDSGLTAWIVVVGSFVGLLGGLGVLNTTGVIQAYIQNNQLADIKVSTVSWIFSIYTFLSFFGGFIVGPLFDYAGCQIPMIAGILCLCGGLMGSGSSTTVWQFVLSFGIASGSGTCLLMTPLIGVISHWFLRKRAIAVGFAMAGSAIGGIVYPLLLRSLYVKVGFPWAMRILGFVCFAVLSVSLILVKDRCSEMRIYRLQRSGYSDEDIANLKIDSKKIIKEIFGSMDFKGFKDKSYLFFTISVLFNEVSLFIVLTYFVSYAMAQGVDESTAIVLLTVVSSAGAPGRYVTGYLADKYGRFNVMFTALTVMTILMLVIWVGFGKYLGAMYAFAVTYGFLGGSTISLTPVCCGQISKTEDFGKRYGTAYCVVAFGILVGLPIAGAIIGDNGSVKGYQNMAIFSSVLCAVGSFFMFLARYSIVGLKITKV
ncbi:hypothetical protein PACTADRAFT_48000 [Pachysolen tannophilus NRRL Y-2460]|uniref:Major facilitator superfamily (MFS) profile domain-containing protein n=1 Tax=Pachysolen tannophilus NRRL Y-2460 TaxID=669874 RepID=A0A1E4U2H7_PACTA|nr:hypothetical protein PACTADRAFT_48000 [Pachysolen tannophilus NRRL Y-2460]